jgi:hypothetical protein
MYLRIVTSENSPRTCPWNVKNDQMLTGNFCVFRLCGACNNKEQKIMTLTLALTLRS